MQFKVLCKILERTKRQSVQHEKSKLTKAVKYRKQ